MAPKVRNGGSHHPGLAAPPHRNIQQRKKRVNGIGRRDLGKAQGLLIIGIEKRKSRFIVKYNLRY